MRVSGADYAPAMRTLDVPQANDLDTVRAVLRATSLGADDLDAVCDFTTFSRRHAQYRLHAGRILGLLRLEGDDVSITPLGERLVEAHPHTDAERQVFYEAVQSSAVLALLAPDLLSRNPPSVEDLAERLFREAGLGRNTALRRAGGLLTWRHRILGPSSEGHAERVTPSAAEQLSLF